jgi:mannose-6-phosphate isomerase
MGRIREMKYVTKPWGSELIVEHTNKYALKDIFLKKSTRSSLQSHHFKLETIFVLDGIVELELWDASGILIKESYVKNEAYTIPPNTKHRVTAIEDCRLIEVSTPELEDVIRHEDDFGRVT